MISKLASLKLAISAIAVFSNRIVLEASPVSSSWISPCQLKYSFLSMALKLCVDVGGHTSYGQERKKMSASVYSL